MSHNDQTSSQPDAREPADPAMVVDKPRTETAVEAGASTAEPGATPTNARQRSRLAGIKWLIKSLIHAAILSASFVGCIAFVGVGQRLGWIQAASQTATEQAGKQEHVGETVFTCPMHPQIRQDEAGKCPICAMALVPVVEESKPATTKQSAETGKGRYICPMMCTPPSTQPGRCPVCAMELVEATGGGDGDGISVTIVPVARRLIGIRTAMAELGAVSQTIRTIGSIDYDQSKLATISAYVGGRIEKLYANYVGVPVKQNDDLGVIYSPDLYSAQVEYLAALNGGGLKRLGGGSNLAELAKQNLVELGLTQEQVTQLRSLGRAESRIRLRSPIKGTVIGQYAVEGDYIKTGTKIYRIADLSTVWLMLDLYPDDAARIRFGQQVESEINAMPGEVFTGRVAFIDPTVNPTTRTVQVRVEMLNPDGKLKPGDYATARIYVPAVRQDRIYDPALANKFISPMHPQVIREKPGECPICGMDLIPAAEFGYASEPVLTQQVVTVPRDAVLMTGESSILYVETGPGRFEIRRVTVGPMTDDRVVVLEGISPGEMVATNGNFLIDSQMQLAGNPSLMDPGKAPSYPPGPLKLPKSEPVMLVGEAGEQLDRAFEAYFTIHLVLAADRNPPPVAVNTLDDALGQLVAMGNVPDGAQMHLQVARRSVGGLSAALEESRKSFRPLSHALLKTAALVRGEKTADHLVHLYCPMVPGGGGDWLQTDDKVLNPYWGSEMLSCGEALDDLAVTTSYNTERK